MISIQVK